MESKLGKLYWGVVAMAAALVLIGLGSYGLLDPDESRFARTSLELMRSGDYVVPTFEGQPRLVKPPLLHWIQAALFRTLGPTEWVARLPAALATIGTVLLVGWAARRRFGDEGAIWAVAVYATMPLAIVLGRIGTTDALLTVHVFAVVALDIAEPLHGGRRRGFATGLLLGLAFLVKGPVGVATALLALFAGRTASGRNVSPALRPALGALGAWAIIVLPWGLAFIERVGRTDVARLINEEVIERAVDGTAHVKPVWFYAPVLVIAVLPWAGLLFAGMYRAIARHREPESRTGLYACAALLACLAMFTVSKGKNVNYLLPLLPIAALLVTWEIGQEITSPRRRRSGASLTVMTCVALAVGLGGAAMIRLEDSARAAAAIGAVVFAVASVAGFAGLITACPRIVFGAAAAAGGAFLVAATIGLTPVLTERRSARPLSEAVPELSSIRPVVIVGMNLPSLTWYLDRVPERIPSLDDLASGLGRHDDALYVFDESDYRQVPATTRSRFRDVGRVEKYRVVEVVPNP